jgi:hypothetical protein
MVRHNQPRKLKPREDKTVIGDKWNGEDRPNYICSWCQCNLVRSSSGNNSPGWFCRRCQIPFEPNEIEIRKKSKLGPQHEEIEPQITSIQIDPSKDVEIRHTPPIRGGFKALKDRGLKITNYKTTEKE